MIGTRFLVVMAALAVSPTVIAGPVWDEHTHGDAGSLLSTAHVTTGAGSLSTILGRLGINPFVGGEDTEDLFRIRITDPAAFFAMTTVNGAAGSSEFDTQLFLFDQAGHCVLGNNDDPNGGVGSLLTGVFNTGIYYLAITGVGNQPRSISGDMFLLPLVGITPPNGPGAGDPLTGWSGGGPGGEYVIHLDGAEVAEVPGPGVLATLVGLIAVGRRRVR